MNRGLICNMHNCIAGKSFWLLNTLSACCTVEAFKSFQFITDIGYYRDPPSTCDLVPCSYCSPKTISTLALSRQSTLDQMLLDAAIELNCMNNLVSFKPSTKALDLLHYAGISHVSENR